MTKLSTYALIGNAIKKIKDFHFFPKKNGSELGSFFILKIFEPRSSFNRWHSFHVLSDSPWPFFTSFFLFSICIDFVSCLADFNSFNFFLLLLSFIFLGYILRLWWGDVIAESNQHTSKIIKNIRIGMSLFILSEVMFFFAFFWAFFHSNIASVEFCLWWPPLGFEKMLIYPFGFPLLNTVLLLSSGVFITAAHKYINSFVKLEITLDSLDFSKVAIKRLGKYLKIFKYKSHSSSMQDLLSFPLRFFVIYFFQLKNKAISYKTLGLKKYLYCIFLALVFIFVQLYEYFKTPYSINDSVFGSCFYLLTGFHGFHVLVGTIFLIVCFFIVKSSNQIQKSDTGLDCAIWYWHFVDVVWLYLFIFVYCMSWWQAQNFLIIFDKSVLALEADTIRNIFFDLTYNDFSNFIYGFGQHANAGFQDPATEVMEKIILLHHYIMYWLFFVSGTVVSLFITIFLQSGYSFGYFGVYQGVAK